MKCATILVCFLSTLTMSAQTYQSAESVAFDPVNGGWLVANGSNIIRDDGNGVLSFFGSGSASHGMEVIGNTLFAISSNIIKGYDLTTEMEVMSLNIPGVAFLNGMASDGIDKLWVTDFSAGKIHQIDVSDFNNPVATEIVADTGGTPNGILFDDTRLLFVTWGSNAAIKAVDITTNVVTDVVANTGLGNIDGIVKNASGNYVISTWSPASLTLYSSDFLNSSIINSSPLSNPADLGVSEDLVGVPMGNDVVFVDTQVLIGFEEFDLRTIAFSVSENPISDNTTLSFKTSTSTDIEIKVYNALGALVGTVFSEEKVLGMQQVPLGLKNSSSGFYFIKVKAGNQQAIKKVMVN